MRSSTPCLLAFALAVGGCAAGLPPPTFEAFDASRLPRPDAYPDAGAVVLLDRGELSFSADPKLKNPLARLRRLRRVLVLRSDGLSEAVSEVMVEPTTRLRGFRVRVTWPNGRVDVLDEPRLRETPDGVSHARIEVPEVQPGVVIETIYDLWFTDPRFVPSWRFDARFPTRRSEYAVVVPPGFEVDLRFSEEGRYVDRPPERFETRSAVRFAWSLADQPARLREESMPSPDLLAPRAHALFRSARIGNVERLGFRTWDDVGAWLLGQQPKWSELSAETRAEAERMAGQVGDEERALRLLEIVARDVAPPEGPPPPVWRSELVHPEVSLATATANPSARGLLLVALLRSIGLPAEPLLYARRDEDIVLPDVPSVRALHGIAAIIPRPEGDLVLDPNDLTVSARVPPPSLMGQRAVRLRSDVAEVTRVPVGRAEDNRSEAVYTLRLDPRGDVFGQLELRLIGAEASALRARLLPVSPERYAEEVARFLEARGASLAPDSVGIADLRVLRRPLVVTGTIDAKGLLPVEGEAEMFHPSNLILGDPGSTPAEVRAAPRTLGPPREVDVRVTLALPEGWRATFAPPEEILEGPGVRTELGARVETERRLGFILRSRHDQLHIGRAQHRRYRQYHLDLAAAAARTFGIARPADRPLEY